MASSDSASLFGRIVIDEPFKKGLRGFRARTEGGAVEREIARYIIERGVFEFDFGGNRRPGRIYKVRGESSRAEYDGEMAFLRNEVHAMDLAYCLACETAMRNRGQPEMQISDWTHLKDIAVKKDFQKSARIILDSRILFLDKQARTQNS